MDLLNRKYHGQITIHGETFELGESNILGLLRVSTQTLNSHTIKGQRGSKSIVIVFADSPVGLSVAGQSDDDILAGVVSDATPDSDESYDEYINRLMAEGHTAESARFFANDFFEGAQDSETLRWINDSKVQRFLELHGSKTMFDSALPGEYKNLMEYVKAEYPERTKDFVWKVA